MKGSGRVLLLLLVAPALVLAGEGLLSLGWQRSLRELVPSAADAPASTTATSQAGSQAGPYRLPDDPLVAYTLQPERELVFPDVRLESAQRTDALGLRARVGPAPAPGALRIVVLGDSVAFGIGMEAGETLAARLERELAALLPPPAAVCFTVALPSWNTRDAWRFLFDHLQHFRPDVVLHLPVENDLDDAYGVTEGGQRRTGEDPSSAQPLLHVRPEWGYLALRLRELRAAGAEPSEALLGPRVLASGVTPLSRARLAGMAELLARGAQRLARAGTRLALVSYEASDFQRELQAELARQGTPLTRIVLLERLLASDTLGEDPHPSAATNAAFARWCAAALQQLGWLPEGSRAAPAPVEARYAERRARDWSDEQALRWSETRAAGLRAALRPRFATESLEGLLQLYGGLNLDASMEPQLAVALAPGRALRVRLAPLEGRPELYPLAIDVFVNERRLGSVEVPSAGVGEARFELGQAEAGQPFDVRLAARDWGVVTVRGRSWVAAARVLELESLP